MHITLTGQKTFRFRLWIAKHLIGLAAKVLNCHITITSDFDSSGWPQ
jgi:hypothetical protein